MKKKKIKRDKKGIYIDRILETYSCGDNSKREDNKDGKMDKFVIEENGNIYIKTDTYEIQYDISDPNDKIGEGGFGKVYKGRYKSLEKNFNFNEMKEKYKCDETNKNENINSNETKSKKNSLNKTNYNGSNSLNKSNSLKKKKYGIVAIKVIDIKNKIKLNKKSRNSNDNEEISKKDTIIKSIENEIRILKEIKSKHIVSYYGHYHWKEKKRVLIIMDYISGGDLAKTIQKYKIDHKQVIVWLKQILIGVRDMHMKDVVNGDLKCSNVLIDNNGKVLLTDFGISSILKGGKLDSDIKKKVYDSIKLLKRNKKSSSRGDNKHFKKIDSNKTSIKNNEYVSDKGYVYGEKRLNMIMKKLEKESIESNIESDIKNDACTPHWSSLERLMGLKPKKEDDIWSIGCMVIELLTGKPPLYDKSYFNLISTLMNVKSAEEMIESEKVKKLSKNSPKLYDFILKCFDPNPKTRPSVKTLLNHDLFFDIELKEYDETYEEYLEEKTMNNESNKINERNGLNSLERSSSSLRITTKK